MGRTDDIDKLKSNGFDVQEDAEAGILRITGPGLDVSLPLSGEESDSALALYASDDWISGHQEARSAPMPDPAPMPAPDETQQMIDTLRAQGYTILQEA